MRAPHLTVHDEDARPWLRDSEGGYDVIVLDAYRQPYIPFYLATREFFELARDRLAPGGLVIVNVGHPEGSTELERVIGRTMAEAFPLVLRDPIEDENTLMIGGARGSAGQLRGWRPDSPPELQAIARVEARRLGPALDGRRGLHRRPRPGRVARRPLDPRLRGRGVSARNRRQIRRVDQRPSAASESARSIENDARRPGAPV